MAFFFFVDCLCVWIGTQRGEERGPSRGTSHAFTLKTCCVPTSCFELSEFFKIGESQTVDQLAYSCFQTATCERRVLLLRTFLPPDHRAEQQGVLGWNAADEMLFPCAVSHSSRTSNLSYNACLSLSLSLSQGSISHCCLVDFGFVRNQNPP